MGLSPGQRAMNTIVESMAKTMGIPDDLTEKVRCVDCGKQDMAAHFAWQFTETDYTGPHCGCKRRSEP